MLNKKKNESEISKDEKQKRSRKVRSLTEGNSIIIKVTMDDDSEKSLNFDTSKLPSESRDRLVIEGACTRLVQFAGGKKGEEAVTGIEAGWKLLVDNNWKDRRKPTEKITKKTILSNLDKLPVQEQEKAKAILNSVGISL